MNGARMLRVRFGAAALALAALLASCATPEAGRPVFTAEAHQWSGRIGVVIDSEPPRQFSAAFDLTGDRDAGELSLTSPLGSTIAVLQWKPGAALLRQGDQTKSYASLDALTAAVTGVALPLAALFSWLHGADAKAEGWRADLSQQSHGRLSAYRESPLPVAHLQVVVSQE
jgi:outer membrane lipoprotein LolB